MEFVECQWEQPVVCNQCGHSQNVVSKETEVCESCGSQLVIYCRSCHLPNLRSDQRCRHCRKQLHRTRSAHSKSLVAKKIPFSTVLIIVFATICLSAAVIYALSQIDWVELLNLQQSDQEVFRILELD